MNPIQIETQESPLNKVLRFTLVLLIVVAIGVGVLLYIDNKRLAEIDNMATISPTVVVNKEKISPTMSVAEKNDPSNINIGSVEADLKDIGTDVNSLQ